MSITRLDYRTRVANLADINGSPRWDFTSGSTGEVDQHLGVVHAREWKRILSDQPYYTIAQRTPTSDGLGQIAISDLSTGLGTDTAQRFYRCLMVAMSNFPYEEMQGKDAFLSQLTIGGSYRIWYRTGDYIVVPDSPNQVATGIWVNYTPTRSDQLLTDASLVVFPDDYEDVLVYEGAAALLTKGGTQTDTAGEFKAIAESMRADMLQDIARFSTKPIMVQFPDFRSDWSSSF